MNMHHLMYRSTPKKQTSQRCEMRLRHEIMKLLLSVPVMARMQALRAIRNQPQIDRHY